MGLKEASKFSLNDLTLRQIEIIDLVSQGYNNREIGEMLFVTERTIKNHITNVHQFLRTENRVQLTLWYLMEKGRLQK